jgi:hypothetical protein
MRRKPGPIRFLAIVAAKSGKRKSRLSRSVSVAYGLATGFGLANVKLPPLSFAAMETVSLWNYV